MEPPDPFGIIRRLPGSQGLGQLTVAVARSQENFSQHGLPGCDGGGAGWFEVGPVWGPQDVGVALAFPNVWVDMGASSVAALRQESDPKMQPDWVEGLEAFGSPIASDQFVHEEDVSFSVCRNSGKRAPEGQASCGELLPGELNPAFGGQVAVQWIRQVPEGFFGPDIALNQLHVLQMKIVGGRVTVAVGNDGVQVFD